MARLDTAPPFGPRPGIRRDAPPAVEPGAQTGPVGDDAHFGPRAGAAQLASAFRDLEPAICDLKYMAALMNTAAEDTVFNVEGCLGQHLRERSGLRGYRIHVLTEDQDDGLTYAINHLNDLIRKLHETYYAGFGERAAS